MTDQVITIIVTKSHLDTDCRSFGRLGGQIALEEANNGEYPARKSNGVHKGHDVESNMY